MVIGYILSTILYYQVTPGQHAVGLERLFVVGSSMLYSIKVEAP